MVRQVLFGLVVVGLYSPIYAQDDFRIASVQVKGVKRYTVEDVVRLSGLKVGGSASGDDLKAAANRLASTGLFDNVRFTYTTTNRAMTISFDVVEAAWTVPVVLDNFVWLPDERWVTEVRADVPSFDGTAPANGAAPDFLAQALQRVIAAHRIPGRVEFTPQVNLKSGTPSYVFAVRDPSPKACALHVKGAAAVPEAELIAPLKTVIGADYSRSFLMSAARGSLTDMYRRRGFWRATFGTPVATIADCDGASVTLPVDEGAAYTWDHAEWAGNHVVTADVLDKALAMKKGELADASKIDSGLRAAYKVYAAQGYLALTADPQPLLDDAARRATFAIAVTEGPQYHMGNFSVQGLRESDAASLAKKWRLKAGDVYDDSYETKYLQDEIFPLRTVSGGRGRLDREIDQSGRVVNVKVVFN